MQKQTICLNMIVKDEAHVIRRCLDSVRPLIDRWVIVDTGSSDGTQDVIREALADLPGQLHERPWQNFGHNRSEAIELARDQGDYLLFIDADDILAIDADFHPATLSADAYELEILYGQLRYWRVCLVRNNLPWRWCGVLHEYLECGQSFNRERLQGVCMHIVGGGDRSQGQQIDKFSKDAQTLESALHDDPDNTRYQFYLAQSYRDSRQLPLALKAYERRSTMGGFAEEVFCSLLQAARIARQLQQPPADVIDRYLRAHEARTSRAEALGELALYCRESGPRWALAYLFASRAIEIGESNDVLFVEPEWYGWRCLDEFAIAAYWTGNYAASKSACERLLQSTALPDTQRERVKANLRFAEQALERH